MQRYYKFSQYLKDKFGCRVYKVSVDAGFKCPNRDGSLSKDGCIYCDNRAFSFNSRGQDKSLKQQIQEGMEFGRKRYKAKKFIVYFQPNTNTYASVDVLKKKYDVIREFKDVVGLSIGTRPDCINEGILSLINEYVLGYDVWLEYGLQSIHDKTLKILNRNHTYKDFLKATEAAKKRNIKVCAHVILGLPVALTGQNETEGEIIQTATELSRIKIDGVKIHPLHIIKGTKLQGLFRSGFYKPLTEEQFLDLVVKFLQHLSPDIVVQRIGADCPPEFLIEPQWVLDKSRILNRLEEEIKCQPQH